MSWVTSLNNGIRFPRRRVSLSEVAQTSKGDQLNRSGLASHGDYPVINGGIAPSGWHNNFNRDAGVSVVSQGGASAGFVTYMDQAFWAGAHCYVVKADDNVVLDRYLYHELKRAEPYLQSKKTGAGIPGLNKSVLTSLELYLPSLEVQQEIAEILDNFVALEAELEAELEARKKQYLALSQHLLSSDSFGHTVSWGKLGEVVRIKNGSDWKNLPNGDIPVYGSGGIIQHVGLSVHPGPSVLIPRKGSIGNIFYAEVPFWTVDTCFYTEIDSAKAQPRFLYHYLRYMDLASLNVAGGVPSLTQTQLNNVPFPRLSIQRQSELVKVLDAIENLIEDDDGGLHVELAARRKQYNYYRDQLLAFREV